jgi:hypothetical protein
MHKNLSMVDFAALDPRSIPAMLRGTGNGCEKVWLRFARQHAVISDHEVLMSLFAREARYGRVGTNKLNLGWILLTAFVILI